MSILPEDLNIFVIDLKYTAPLDQIDPLIKSHVIFLENYYSNNTFIASGAKVPRDGGVILAKAKSKDEINLLLKEDPFYKNNVATYTVTEFNPKMAIKGLLK